MDNSLKLIYKAGEALQVALKHRDEYTQYHCERVAAIAKLAGEYFKLNKEELYQLETAAIFHDIGKIGIPDDILLNPGKLTATQYEHMKTHSVVGANITEKLDIPHAENVADIIRHHHEHFDGSGYPYGMKGEEIPISSRIICIIDVFDALSSNRCYRTPIKAELTLAKMKKEMSHQFDPHVFQVVADVIQNTILHSSIEKSG